MWISCSWCIAGVLLLSCALHAQEESAPGDKIKARAAADAELFLPQRGVGGSAKVALEVLTPIIKNIKIEAEGCEKLKGHVGSPATMDRSRKHPLVVTFSGFGDQTSEGMADLFRVSGVNDPAIVCSVTYYESIEEKEGFSRIERLAEDEAVHVAYKWLMKKAMADYPIDLERVFLLSTMGEDDEATDFASALWTEDADAFPFRAILLEGLVTVRSVASFPPVPVAIVSSKNLIEINESFGNERTPKNVANELMAAGIATQYHVYEMSGFAMSSRGDRAWMILRDVIATLGGPGPQEYPGEVGPQNVITDADKVPWTVDETPDANIQQVVAFVEQEQWGKARQRIETLLDGKLSSKQKRDVKAFSREFEKYVKDEIDRCNDSVQVSIKADVWPHSLHRARLKSMYEAFKDERWVQSKKYNETLEALQTFGPAVRDKERKELLVKASRLELEGKRAEAKKLYQQVAAQVKEDGGQSEWPYAAEYRLSWWND